MSFYLRAAGVVAASALLFACNLHDHSNRVRAPSSQVTLTKAEAPKPAEPEPKPEPAPDPPPAKSDKIEIPAQIQFVVNSAKIAPGSESTKALEELARVLKANPSITKLRIEGHTDDSGTAKSNQKLSKDRAGAVVKWLVKNGIDKKRLESTGLGASRPLAKDSTEEGRALNRRTEFHVVELDGKPFDPSQQELVVK
jgi:OmpA-OmpF porin, OOP family